MVVLGLVLLIGAGVFAVAVVASNTGAVGADLWGLHISNLSLGEAFVAGVATGVVALLAVVMLFAGTRRAQRLRRERRELARENARLVQHAGSEPPAEPQAWQGQPGATAPAAVPAERAEQPVYPMGPAHQGPPPPSYDRATIESERGRADADGYQPVTAGQPPADEASRRQP